MSKFIFICLKTLKLITEEVRWSVDYLVFECLFTLVDCYKKFYIIIPLLGISRFLV